jgi:hypothetical protein
LFADALKHRAVQQCGLAETAHFATVIAIAERPFHTQKQEEQKGCWKDRQEYL